MATGEPIGPLGFYALSHQRHYPSGFQAMAMPLLSSRVASPTCFPADVQQEDVDGGVDMDTQIPVIAKVEDSSAPIADSWAIPNAYDYSACDGSSLSASSNFTRLPHSSPSSIVCSPATSPIPIITTSAPPSPSHVAAEEILPPSFSGFPCHSPANASRSPSLSPSPPFASSSNVNAALPTPAGKQMTQASHSAFLSSSRPSSPLFPSVGPSPSSSSPTQDCYSPVSSPFPTPANTPRPSICTTDSGHSEMEQDSSPLSDDVSSVPPMLLEIKGTHRKSVGDVLLAVKAALDSICPQVDYECSETSFRLNGHSDLLMELEVCSETDGYVPGLQVRKLSGDNLEYAKLCNHLMACVNN